MLSAVRVLQHLLLLEQRSTNPGTQLLQQMVDKAYVPAFARKLNAYHCSLLNRTTY